MITITVTLTGDVNDTAEVTLPVQVESELNTVLTAAKAASSQVGARSAMVTLNLILVGIGAAFTVLAKQRAKDIEKAIREQLLGAKS